MGGGGECGLSYISCEKSDINSCNSHVFSLKEQILALEEKLFDLLHHAILPPKVWHGAGGGGGRTMPGYPVPELAKVQLKM